MLNGYAHADAYVALTLGPGAGDVQRGQPDRHGVRVLGGHLYLGQTDPSFIYANQVMLGAPRTYSVMLHLEF